MSNHIYTALLNSLTVRFFEMYADKNNTAISVKQVVKRYIIQILKGQVNPIYKTRGQVKSDGD